MELEFNLPVSVGIVVAIVFVIGVKYGEYRAVNG